MAAARPTGPAGAFTVCVAVFSMATGFLAGTAAFSGRLATVETQYRQVQDEIHEMRSDMTRIADKLGAARPTPAAQTLSEGSGTWGSESTRHYPKRRMLSGN